MAVSVYEHWNTDQIDISFDQWVPKHIDPPKHDVPDIQFNTDQVQHAAYAIQSFVIQVLDMDYPNEWYVPIHDNFQGFGDVDKNIMEYVDDKMTPILINWLPAPDTEECPNYEAGIACDCSLCEEVIAEMNNPSHGDE
ncbi:MAG: hypothetical protein KAR08_06790 [Candidatus Heimdallarchaeota archaeon]|nr:hypothetical protein [Candidatus Heimdallarchaeota archaeon]